MLKGAERDGEGEASGERAQNPPKFLKSNAQTHQKFIFFRHFNSSSYPITSIYSLASRLIINPTPFISSSQCITNDLRSQELDPSSNVASETPDMLHLRSRRLLHLLRCPGVELKWATPRELLCGSQDWEDEKMPHLPPMPLPVAT